MATMEKKGKNPQPAQNKNSSTKGTEAPTPQAVSYTKLYSHAAPFDWVLIVVGTLGAILAGSTMPLFAVVFADLVDKYAVAPENATHGIINGIALNFVYLAIAALIGSFLEMSFFMWTGVRQASKIRQLYLHAALRQDVAFYDVQSTSGGVLSALNEDTQAVQNAIGEKVGNTIHHFTTFLVAVGIVFFRGWKLSLVMLSLTPLLIVGGATIAKIMTTGTEIMSKAYARAQTLANQAFVNVRTIVSFGSEEVVVEAYRSALVVPTKTGIKLGTYSGMATGFTNAVFFMTYGVAFYYGAKLVREGGYTGGDVMNIIFGLIIGGFSLGNATPNFQYFVNGRVAGRRLFEIIERVPPISLLAEGIVPTAPTRGDIMLSDVAFAYPTRPEMLVFKAFSLTIAAGQNVALVGASGSGKSTVIQLLERFYDPSHGSVTLDGVDIRTLSLPWYRSQVGLVSQEPTLFATTIKANILLGREAATDEEVAAAAEAANAHKFISLLPQGYNTQVGERGVQLSGGQKQRIAIARAILKNPRILLLDEATSALDTRSERMVQSAIDRLAVGRTSVVVAHRLSTIRGAEKIAVVQAGTVVEEGTHSELFAREGSVYHSLVKLQEQVHAIADEPLVEDDQLEQADKLEVAQIMGSQRELETEGGRVSASHRRSVDHKSSVGVGRTSLDTKHGQVAAVGDADDLNEEEKKVKVGMARLIQLNKPEWGYLIVGALVSAVLGVTMPGFAILLAEIISVFSYTDQEKARKEALLYSMLFFALGVGFFIFASIQGFCFSKSGVLLAERVRIMLIRSILFTEIGWFDKDENTSGAISTRLSTDAASVRGATGDILGVLIQNLVTVITAFVIAFSNGWKMTLVVLAVLPLVGFSSFMQMKFFSGVGNDGDAIFQKANQTAAEGILAIRTVASFGLEKKVAEMYTSMLREPFIRSQKNGVKMGLAFGFAQSIQFAFYALAFWYGGQLLIKGEMNLKQMLKVFMSILLSSLGASQAQLAFPEVSKGAKAVKRVFVLVDRKSLIDASKPEGLKPADVAGEIILKNVSFAYPSRPDVAVFKNFNLTASARQITALVGESGSGKSTIINLVERFYDPSSGQVFLDSNDLRSLNLQWLRQSVGLVSQEPMLFNATILENIKYGKPEATLDEVIAAARVANALDFIEAQPDKFGTLLGEGGGISLSGGQKQRVAIARAVLKDPRVLLLDEATSALDAESERLVQEALDRIMVGRTSIVIAHRLTTVRNAHKIAVVQRGVVLEQGSHDELMRKGGEGAYYNLARAQMGAV